MTNHGKCYPKKGMKNVANIAPNLYKIKKIHAKMHAEICTKKQYFSSGAKIQKNGPRCDLEIFRADRGPKSRA